MIPSVLSTQVRRGLQDFLLTTFPITNPFFNETIERLFERDEVFRGAYVSLKLPFAPALRGPKQFHRILPPNFSPYRHQQRAWQRLDSRGRAVDHRSHRHRFGQDGVLPLPHP